MNNRINAVYARLSVDRADSISIESQIEFCQYELKGGNFKEYIDKGYSEKNVDRPQFQKLMADIEQGLIAKVVVYKPRQLTVSQLTARGFGQLFKFYSVVLLGLDVSASSTYSKISPG